MTSVSEVDWKIETAPHQVAANGHCVGDIAIMRNRKSAGGKVGHKAAAHCAAEVSPVVE